MLFMALRVRASEDEILDEARGYLAKKGVSGFAAEEQLARVAKFIRSAKLVRRKKSAWLITRRSDVNSEGTEVVAILDSRRSVDRVREFLEQFHIATEYGLSEKLLYAARPKENPYPAKANVDRESMRVVNVSCGHNPWLDARLVRNLEVMRSGEQTVLTWLEGRESRIALGD